METDRPKIKLSECFSGYRFRKNEFALIKNINFEIFQGELVALIGKNGSGKTTLLKTIAGLIPALQGEIFIDGTNLGTIPRDDLARKTGFHSALITDNKEMFVEDLVRLGRYPYTNLFGVFTVSDMQAIQEAMQVCGITHLARRKLDQVSDGELQRAMLARVFAQNTDIILLDEPTSYLDIPNKYSILNLLKNLSLKGKTILFTTHDLNLATAFCDKLLLISKKDIVEGSPEDIFMGNELKEEFENENLLFHRETGEFIPSWNSEKEVAIVAEKHTRLALNYTKKALRRVGLNFKTYHEGQVNAPIIVYISKEKDKFVWNMEHLNEKTRCFNIYHLVNELKKRIQNELN